MDPYVNIYGFNWFHLRIITVKIFKAKGLESIYLLQLNRLYSENSRKRVCFARLFLCFPCVLFGTTLWYALLFCLLFFVKCLLFYRLTARKAELNFFFYWILNLFHKEELFERPFFQSYSRRLLFLLIRQATLTFWVIAAFVFPFATNTVWSWSEPIATDLLSQWSV